MSGRTIRKPQALLDRRPISRSARTPVATGVALVLVVACGGSPSQPSPPAPTPAPDAVLVGAGDIADCAALQPAYATASLLDGISGTVFTAGDNTYMQGTEEKFQNCYGPTWGRHKSRTRPAPGNHEYEVPGAVPYYNYFGSAAGSFGQGYYSYTAGNWHVISLNSNDHTVMTVQLAWLRSDLQANRVSCTVAYFHNPLFTSGPNGSSAWVRDLWQVLYDAGVEIVINGHEHFYERFAPQDPDGRADPSKGIREFIAGTGGGALYFFGPTRPNSEVRIADFGVLKLTLKASSYDWEFITVNGGTRDFGSGACH